MKPVDQENAFGCLRACIASIFELPAKDVPEFGKDTKGTDRQGVGQDSDLRKWLADRGVSLIHLVNPHAVLASGAKSAHCPWGYCVAGGKSPRGKYDHAVVYQVKPDDNMNPVMVHDPHPSRAGFAGDPTYYTCFRLDDPSKMK